MPVKSIFALICALVCAMVFATPVCGASASYEGYSAKLDDLDNCLTDEQEMDLIIVMNIAAQTIKCNIGVVITADLEGMSSYDYAFNYLDSNFGAGSSSIVLLLCNDQVHPDWIATDNRATDMYDSQTDYIFDFLYEGFDSSGYYAAIKNFCIFLESNNINSGSSTANSDNTVNSSVSYNSGYSVKLDDLDDCLNDNEERNLIIIMESTAEIIECNIGVVITADLEGMSSYDYVFDYLDNNFGAGSSSIVLLLCNDHVHQDWIATDNRATDKYGSQTDYIFDYLYKGLDNSGYYAAIDHFCTYLKNNNTVGSNSGDYHGEFSFSLNWEPEAVIFVLIFSFVIAFCFTKSATSKYTKKAPISARTYLDKDRTVFLQRDEVFVREFTTSHSVGESSSGSHRSGGRGGGGGHHRSGRGGGGGRRR